MRRTRNKSDTRVAKRGEVLHCLANSVQIIDPYIYDARSIRSHVDEYQWDLTEAEMIEQRVFHTKRQNGHSIDATLDHPADRRFHPLRIMHG